MSNVLAVSVVALAKDTLRIGGADVAASRIKRVIASVVGVSDAAVAARCHPMRDEVPVAFVIPPEAGDATLADRSEAACMATLVRSRRPVGLRIVDALLARCSEENATTLVVENR